MNFLIFVLYYFICSLFIFVIAFFIIKFLLKKKCFDVSKFAEKEIDNYFHAYDNNLDSLISELEEGMKDVNTTNGEARDGENIDPNKFRL